MSGPAAPPGDPGTAVLLATRNAGKLVELRGDVTAERLGLATDELKHESEELAKQQHKVATISETMEHQEARFKDTGMCLSTLRLVGLEKIGTHARVL